VIPWSLGGNDATKETSDTGEGVLFRARIDQIINVKHELGRLAGALK
jgi:hypothetical protein